MAGDCLPDGLRRLVRGRRCVQTSTDEFQALRHSDAMKLVSPANNGGAALAKADLGESLSQQTPHVDRKPLHEVRRLNQARIQLSEDMWRDVFAPTRPSPLRTVTMRRTRCCADRISCRRQSTHSLHRSRTVRDLNRAVRRAGSFRLGSKNALSFVPILLDATPKFV